MVLINIWIGDRIFLLFLVVFEGEVFVDEDVFEEGVMVGVVGVSSILVIGSVLLFVYSVVVGDMLCFVFCFCICWNVDSIRFGDMIFLVDFVGIFDFVVFFGGRLNFSFFWFCFEEVDVRDFLELDIWFDILGAFFLVFFLVFGRFLDLLDCEESVRRLFGGWNGFFFFGMIGFCGFDFWVILSEFFGLVIIGFGICELIVLVNGCDIFKIFLLLLFEIFVLFFLNGLFFLFGVLIGGGLIGGGFVFVVIILFVLLCFGDILGDDVNWGLRFLVVISRFWLVFFFFFFGLELFWVCKE